MNKKHLRIDPMPRADQSMPPFATDRPFIIPDVRDIARRAFVLGQKYAVDRMTGKLRQIKPQSPPEPIIDALIEAELSEDAEQG